MSDARPLTGRKVLAITLAAFGVIIAANLALVIAATGSFPGLVVKNSYVASQEFDARRDAMTALGWSARPVFENGHLTVAITGKDGRPVRGLAVEARIGRPASDAEDRVIALDAEQGGYGADVALAPGRWEIGITADDGEARPATWTTRMRVDG